MHACFPSTSLAKSWLGLGLLSAFSLCAAAPWQTLAPLGGTHGSPPGPCPAPTTYCTANATSAGCVMKMSSTGVPSLASPLAFQVVCNNVQAGEFGVQMFGTTGDSTTPFSNGLLCVNPPLHRLKIKNAGGALACDGVLGYSLADVLANATGGPLVVVGQKINQQTWIRDPGSLVLTAVSDGIEYIACP